MKYKKIVMCSFFAALSWCQLLPAQQVGPTETRKAAAPVYIAPQVAAVIDAGVGQRQTRHDIPLTYVRTFFLPAQQNQIYPIFIFKIKNADLNLAAAADSPEILRAKFHVFTRLYRLENSLPGAIVRERYIPFNFEENKANFLPEATPFYSIATEIYPAGNYLLALAISTPDFSRISVSYHEVVLPDCAQLQNKLDATPVFSVNGLQQMPAADTRIIIHKNSFVYNTLLLSPSISNEFRANESLDLFYFVLGARPDAGNAYDIQITYIFKKDGKELRKLGPAQVKNIIISQPISLSYTEITKDAQGVETERKEIRLEPGDYTLEINMLDGVSKAAGRQEFKFKVVI